MSIESLLAIATTVAIIFTAVFAGLTVKVYRRLESLQAEQTSLENRAYLCVDAHHLSARDESDWETPEIGIVWEIKNVGRGPALDIAVADYRYLTFADASTEDTRKGRAAYHIAGLAPQEQVLIQVDHGERDAEGSRLAFWGRKDASDAVAELDIPGEELPRSYGVAITYRDLMDRHFVHYASTAPGEYTPSELILRPQSESRVRYPEPQE